MMTNMARIVSTIFSPLILPLVLFTYAAVRLEHTASERFFVIIIGCLFFVLIPWIILLWMKRMEQIDSIDVTDRTARYRPFMYALMSMALGFIAFSYAPVHNSIVYMFFAIIALNNTSIASLINLKWKISIHAMSMGATCVMIFFLSGSNPVLWPGLSIGSVILIAAFTMLMIMVQTSRVILGHHTPAQVIAGTILSVILTVLQISLFFDQSLQAIQV